jgi:hypothetical protein
MACFIPDRQMLPSEASRPTPGQFKRQRRARPEHGRGKSDTINILRERMLIAR